MSASWQESYDKPRQCLKKRRHHFAAKSSYSQRYGISSCHLWMLELVHKEGWVPKNWCLQTVVLEKTPESLLDSEEIKLINLKGNQPWIFTRRSDAEVETALFWSSDVNSWLIEKFPNAGKDWWQKEKRASVDERAGWHRWCNAHELGQTLGDGEGQRGRACYSPWGRKESGMTAWLKNNNQVTKVYTSQ